MLLGILLLAAPLAAAHAEIASVEPPSGARLDAAPTRVRLELTQPVEPSNLILTVTDQDGRRVDQGDVEFTGGQRPIVTISLEPELPDGAYLVTLTATSLTDSHRITYTRSFAVGGFVPFETSDTTDDLDAVGAAARATAYVGLALVLGALVLGARLAWPHRLVLPTRLGAGLHAGGVGWLLVRMQTEAQQAWSSYLDSQVGTVMAVRGGLALVLFLVALAMPPRNAQRAASLGIVVVLTVIATARFTHASDRGPGAIANDVIHILCAGAWVGGLVLLLWLWLDRGRDAVADARAFSTPALIAVTGIATTGVIASILILGPDAWRAPPALVDSQYGGFLLGKVGLALAMVAVAAVNRYGLLGLPGDPMPWLRRAASQAPGWLRPATAAGAQPRSGLSRLVAVEGGLGVTVLVLAGLLLSSSPPAVAQSEDVLRLTGEGDDFLVTALLEPAPVAGTNSSMRFYVEYTPDHGERPGEPVENATCGGTACIQVILSDANATLRESWIADPQGEGWWRVDILWPRSGTFDLTVRVSTQFVFQDDVALAVTVA